MISYANEWEDYSNSWGTTHSPIFWKWLGTVLAPLGVSFSLRIEDRGLVEFDLSSWTHLILIGSWDSLGLCHSFKRSALLLPSCFVFFSWALSGPQCSLYNLLKGQPEDRWPLEEKCCKYPISLDIQAFILPVSYNMCNNGISVSLLGWVTGTQCLLEVHMLVVPFKGNWASEDNVCHFGS